MASLVKKVKKGKSYYYIVESKRVNGKPRIVKQTYLGTLDRILETHRNQTAPNAQEVDLCHLGPMALWDVAVSLNLPAMIDNAFPKRRGPLISQFLLLAALGRAFAPCSKVKIGEWYEKTALQREWGYKPETFSSQNFWNAMSRIDLTRLAELEKEISLHIAHEENLTPRALLYDCTNYFTYIDTLNERNTQAQRGHNKQGRDNLRQLGLAVGVTPDFHIPLFHALYPGNLNDVTEFYTIYDDLVDRLQALANGGEGVTLILDKGNMSENTLFLFGERNVRIIAAASIANHADLQEIGLNQFEQPSAQHLPGISAWRCRKESMGYEWTMVMEHSTNLAAQQYQAVATEQAKAIVKLADLCKQLQQGKLPNATTSSVKTKVAKILKAQHIKKIIHVSITSADGYPLLTYSLNHESLQNLLNHLLGRKILITNCHGWNTTEIILAYHGQAEVERFFQESKNPDYLAFQPSYHWTDQKLRVHAFYCVLALALTGILRRRLSQQGLDLSTEQLLEQLHEIQEASLLYPPTPPAPPRISYCLARPNAIQKTLFNLLNLSRHTHQLTTS
jgi:transposase